MISKRNEKLFERLVRLAQQSRPHLQTGRVFHMAFAIDKGHIVSLGYNSYEKTSPDTLNYEKENSTNYFPKIHAESDLIRKLKKLKVNYSKIKILVVCIKNNNKAHLSKPCLNCAYNLGLQRFKEVWYSTETGFEKL
ncbi:MAG TPA: hypothetical protein PLP33_29210 [Leptospiraceae bacterium]|nr:hypothetical protein [Leptospiraceae bacterium]